MAKGKILKTIIDISGEISPTLGKTLDGVVNKLEGVNLKAVAVGASIAALGGAAVVGVGKATGYLKDLGTEYDKASNQMAASTGLVGEELANMEKQMKDVYKGNYGDDMQDVADSMTEVYKQTNVAGDALQHATEDAIALRDVFGYEVSESARAAKAIMENFGTSSYEAFGLIAAGAQNGLDFSGELIDSISEYSVQFSKLGFSADDMFHIFQKGAESGAWNLDKVGDAIKEFSIRSIDGSKTTTNAYKALGLNADKMMATFAKGGKGAEDAFQQVIKKLVEVDDEVKRDEIGVALLGTMWEDLGVDAVKALADVKGGAYDTGDALGKINDIKYNDLDSAMQGIKRSAEVALMPAAESVSEAFMKIAPKIQKMVEDAAPYIADLAEKIGPAIEKAVELGEQGFGFVMQKIDELGPVVSDFVDNGLVWVKNNMEWLIPVVGGLAGAIATYKAVTVAMTIWEGIKAAALASGTVVTGLATAATWALGTAVAFLTSPIFLAALAIGALIAIGIALWRNWDTVKEKATQLGAWLSKTWTNIKNAVSQKFSEIAAAVSNKWNEIKSKTAEIWGNLVSGLQEKWSDIKSKVGEMISGVKQKLQDGWSKLKDILLAPFEAVKGVIDDVAGKIGNLKGKISGAVDTVKGWIPKFAAGGFTNGISIAGEDPRYPTEAVLSFNPAYRSENLAYWAQAGRMLGADISDFTLGGGNSSYTSLGGVTFAPNIVIHGNADKRTIMEAIEDEYPEFLDMLEEFLAGRRDPVYA